MEFLELAKSRYSVRKFKKEQISDEELAAVLEVAKHSPTALNFQPQKIYVLKSDEADGKNKFIVQMYIRRSHGAYSML